MDADEVYAELAASSEDPLYHGARSDLLQLRRYVIGRFDAATWSRSLAELRDRVALLADQPRLGAVPPELEDLGIDTYLELAVGRNRLI